MSTGPSTDDGNLSWGLNRYRPSLSPIASADLAYTCPDALSPARLGVTLHLEAQRILLAGPWLVLGWTERRVLDSALHSSLIEPPFVLLIPLADCNHFFQKWCLQSARSRLCAVLVTV